MKWASERFEQLARDALNRDLRNVRRSELIRERRVMLIVTAIGFLLVMTEIFGHGQPLSLIACIGVFVSGLVNLVSIKGSLRLLCVIESIGNEIQTHEPATSRQHSDDSLSAGA